MQRDGALSRPSIFEAAGGQDAFLRVAEAWHERALADPVVSHAFSHGHRPDHTERLAAYLEHADLPADPELRAAIVGFWEWATARMSDYPRSTDDVPEDLAMPRWGWDGPATP